VVFDREVENKWASVRCLVRYGVLLMRSELQLHSRS
jgi:hypothetical protein